MSCTFDRMNYCDSLKFYPETYFTPYKCCRICQWPSSEQKHTRLACGAVGRVTGKQGSRHRIVSYYIHTGSKQAATGSREPKPMPLQFQPNRWENRTTEGRRALYLNSQLHQSRPVSVEGNFDNEFVILTLSRRFALMIVIVFFITTSCVSVHWFIFVKFWNRSRIAKLFEYVIRKSTG